MVIDNNLETFYYEKDHRFSTTHDFKTATILANDIFQKYIENKIINSSDIRTASAPTLIENKKLRWTGSKTSLIELIYALHSNKVFNDGKADLIEIAIYFENIFNIQLGDIYRTSNGIKNRKINKTKFLDVLKENLNKRYEEKGFK